jgi:hypothetical protein
MKVLAYLVPCTQQLIPLIYLYRKRSSVVNFSDSQNIKARKSQSCASLLASCALTLMLAGSASAQSFSRLTTTLPGFLPGAMVAGDFDNDGKLDLLLTGNANGGYITQIWRGLGNGTFTNINAGLPGLFKSTAAWGDYDNDGKLDILIAGLDNNMVPRCQLWHNQGNGTFVQSSVLLPGLSSGSVAWGDFDGDGDLDLLLTGADANGLPFAQIWRNQGNGSFANMNVALTPVKSSSVAVADLNGDGYQDIVLTGMASNNVPVAQIWRNLGNGNFALTNTGFTGVYCGSVALGDYDNDGKVDILLTGMNASGQAVAQLWRNQGNFTFSNITTAIPPMYLGSAVWSDFDNDGKLDVLISGYGLDRAAFSQIWRNVGTGSFTNINAGLTSLGSSFVGSGDFDNDGKLDIVMVGSSSTGYVSQVWRNTGAKTNNPPATPTGLTSTLTATGVILSWQPASDPQTPSTGLTYNVRVGTKSGGSEIMSASSDGSTGFKRLPTPGNVRQALVTTLSLPPGIYYWSVQAVDTSFAGSPFAAESTFVVDALVTTTAATDIGINSALLHGTINPRGINTTAWFRWGSNTSYGKNLASQSVGNGVGTLDFSQALLGLQPGTTYHYSLVATDDFGLSYGSDQVFTTTPLTPPILQDMPNFSTALSTPTPALPVKVSSAVVPATSLVVSAKASDSNLIPASGLVLGGSGTNRTLTISPAAGLRGATAISVSVSDGTSVTTKSFLLNVGMIPGDLNLDGIVDQNELNTVLSNYWSHSPWLSMANFTPMCNQTTFQFTLTNATAWNFSVLVSTDYVNWSVLPNPALPVYQFVDPQAATNSARHYRLRWP